MALTVHDTHEMRNSMVANEIIVILRAVPAENSTPSFEPSRHLSRDKTVLIVPWYGRSGVGKQGKPRNGKWQAKK